MILNDQQRKDLRQRIDHLERLHTELAEVKLAIRDSFDAAKSAGYDVKAMRDVLKLRMMEPDERDDLRAREDVRDAYRHALGLFADTPLGAYAVEHAGKSRAAA